MVRRMRIVAMLSTVMLALMGCVAAPGYGYSQTSVAIEGPQVALTFTDGVEAYYESAYGTYIYSDDGYYYRWVGNNWVYASYYGGPWQPVVTTVYLPPLLAYGPPPPLVAYRPYFVWWRLHEARWYAANHPRWWYRHRIYVRHYALWRAHVLRFYRRHPTQRPDMRPFFHHNPQRRFARTPEGRSPYELNQLHRGRSRNHDGPPPFRGHVGYFHPHPLRSRPQRGRPRHWPQGRHIHP